MIDESRAGTIHVLVVDDHRTFAELVGVALDAEPGLRCVGWAASSGEARAALRRTPADLVLMDVDLGGENGIELTRELVLARPDLLVVVLTGHADEQVMRSAADAGACALLAKDGSLDELLHAIRTAKQGGLYVHPDLLRTLFAASRRPSDRGHAPSLTPRERDVLARLARGQQVVAIARHLGISVHTCRGHVKAILAKLGAHSQLEAVVIAGSHGLLDATAAE